MSISQILHHMEQLNRLHEQLLELGERKKQVLIRNEVNELSKITSQESKIVRNIAEQEQQWLQHIRDYVTQQGLQPGEDMTMSDFIQLVVHAEQKQALQKAHHQLLNTIQQLHQLNTLNQQLIEQSLSFIDYTLDLLTGDPTDDLLYHNPAEQVKGNTSGKGIFDTRA